MLWLARLPASIGPRSRNRGRPARRAKENSPVRQRWVPYRRCGSNHWRSQTRASPGPDTHGGVPSGPVRVPRPLQRTPFHPLRRAAVSLQRPVEPRTPKPRRLALSLNLVEQAFLLADGGCQASVCNPGTWAKCASLVASGRSYCRAIAATQRSLSGMGLPSRASSALRSP